MFRFYVFAHVTLLIAIGGSGAAQVALPPFTANPYSDVFVVTGSQAPDSGTVGNYFHPIFAGGVVGSKSLIPGTGHVDGIDVADMDGDGDLDFMLRDGTKKAVFLYTNEGSGLFSPTVVINDGNPSKWTTYLRIDDFNGDGLNDFVLGDLANLTGVKVYIQSPPGLFFEATTLDTSWAGILNVFFGVATGPFDSGPTVDISLFNYQSGELAIYLGDGGGGFSSPIIKFSLGSDFGTGGCGLAAFDLEGDGDLDLALGGRYKYGEVYVYLNDGQGNFVQPATFAFDVDAETGLDSLDFDLDGDHDLMVVTWQTTSLFVVENVAGVLGSPMLIDSNNGKCIGAGAPPLPPIAIMVEIDIKPGSYPNCININGHGVIPVAIIGTDSFSVAEIDTATLSFAGLDVRVKGNGVSQCSFDYVNDDDWLDLVCQFVDDDNNWSPGDGIASVSGRLFDGKRFEGSDEICLVP